MSMIAVESANISTAWLAMANRLLAQPNREAFHTVMSIEDPVAEVPDMRRAVDEILLGGNKQPVETVANTIFPAGVAAQSRTHADLVERYLRMLPTLKRYHKNRRGTYFQRLIAYPTKDGPFDQIDATIKRIGIERATPGPRRARYEQIFVEGGDLGTTATPVYVPGRDNSAMAFPCLSHCSFQLDGERVHLLATYRSQYLVERGYGNYLGLGWLLAYVALRSGLQVGRLTVVAGLTHLENPILPVRALVKRFAGSVATV